MIQPNVTSVFERNLSAYLDPNCNVIVNKGGTRSSKTFSILQLLFLIAYKSKDPLLISVVSESLPHLKKGCIREMNRIMDGFEYNYKVPKRWNESDHVLTVNNSKIEFFSCDMGKATGPERDILFINECQNISHKVYDQLTPRTRGKKFLDYNPSWEFWVDDRVLPFPDAHLIHSTYLDNNFLPPIQVAEIEKRKNDPDWWNVYGLGITGSREGLIYTNWEQVHEMPKDYKKRFLALDFGFSNDPSALLDVMLHGGELWIDELLYAPGLFNRDIMKVIKDKRLQDVPIVADSAEPKSIAEFSMEGFMIEGAEKGPDSINAGIQATKQYKLNVTSRSINLIKELRHYKWKFNKQGLQQDKPIDMWNHAADALRYVVLNKFSNYKNNEKLGTYWSYAYKMPKKF